MENLKEEIKYKDLYSMLDKCTYILSNNLESQLEINEPMYMALQELNEQEIMNTKLKNIEQYFIIQENDEELSELIKKDGEKLLKDVFDELSDYLREEFYEKMQEMDLCDVYQTFHIDEYTSEILEDFGQLLRYNEELNAHFW